MAKLDPSLNRRKFLAASGASLGILASGCKPKIEQPQKAGPPSVEEKQSMVEIPPSIESPPTTGHNVEELLEFEYTDEEWTQFLANWESQLDKIRGVRELNHPNSLAPAQVFDPRLPGIEYESESSHLILAANPDTLPEEKEDIAFAPATHLAHWVHSGKITSLELTELYLERIEKYNTTLQCFITVTPELARRQAKQADAEIEAGKIRGPLHGLPYGIKDLFDTKDISTTWGAAPYKENVATSDAHIVKKLRDAGAVLLGKTSCGALAYGDIWFGGVTRNPWEIREGSSGSSAGSASATAAGLVSFSIGTETQGSIISPAVRCGVTGLRPTFGRVGRTGGMTLCWSLDKIGSICRFVEDTAIVLQAINGPDQQDPGSIPTQFGYDGKMDISEIRVGYDPQFFTDIDSHVMNKVALESAQAVGVQLKEISLPQADRRGLQIQLQVEAAAAFEELTKSNRDDELRWQADRAWPNSWRQARLIPATDYIQADRLRRLFMQEMHQVFQEVDIIIGDNFGGGMLQITNFTGHPQLTLRCGFQERAIKPAFEETGVAEDETAIFPHSIGLWGPLFGEGKLLAVGRALEERLDVKSKRPPM
jgi:Asp-tRNA(Asn)/Glu-tRNA(Gln) amidotransferase A subunit family amidase